VRLRERCFPSVTNKYLVKIAANFKDEKDVAKTFATSSVAGWGGHALGAAAGAAGLGLLASKNKRVGALAERAVAGAGRFGEKIKSTRVGGFLHKHMSGGGAAAVAGGLAGGVVGEEAANYVAIRRGMLGSKKNDK
jgi:hypothetical protein